jgi:hypothetical protein
MEKAVLLQCRKAYLESGETSSRQREGRGGRRNDAQYRAQEKGLDEGVLLLVLVLGGLGVSMGRPRTLTRPR